MSSKRDPAGAAGLPAVTRPRDAGARRPPGPALSLSIQFASNATDLPTRAQVRYVFAQTLLRLGHDTEAHAQLAAFEQLRVRAFDEQRRKFESDSRAVSAPAQ